jgi:hypothetical protein
MPRKVKSGVRKKNQDEIVQLAENILASAAGKTELEDSPLTLVQLGTLKTSAVTAKDDESMAVGALSLARTERREAFGALRLGIDAFAQYAGLVYKHDQAKLQAIYLDVASTPAPTGPLSAPINLRSFVGEMEQTIHLEWNPTVGRDIYIVECAQDLNGPWTQVYIGKKSFAICGGLTSGAEYYFRVRAIGGSTGSSPWSDITRKRAA